MDELFRAENSAETEREKALEEGYNLITAYEGHLREAIERLEGMRSDLEQNRASFLFGLGDSNVTQRLADLEQDMISEAYLHCRAIRTALSCEKETELLGDAVFTQAGEVTAACENGILYMGMPLLLKTPSISVKGFSKLYVQEVRDALRALDLSDLIGRDKYFFRFFFVLPEGAVNVRDNDNYFIKPILDTICMQLQTSDNPGRVSVKLDTSISDHLLPGTYIIITGAKKRVKRPILALKKHLKRCTIDDRNSKTKSAP